MGARVSVCFTMNQNSIFFCVGGGGGGGGGRGARVSEFVLLRIQI